MHVVRSHLRPAEVARLVPPPDAGPTLKRAWPWLFWALWGAWLAVSDLRDGDIRGALLRMMVGAAVLGFARPGTWWLWSLALAAWVAIEPLLGSLLHVVPPGEHDPGRWLLPLLPALVGGLLGRTVATGVTSRAPH